MTIYSSMTQDNLTRAFEANKMLLWSETNYFEIQNSLNTSQEKIKEVIRSSGFCPIISVNSLSGNVVFTITPFTIPDFFLAGHLYSPYTHNDLPATIHKTLKCREPVHNNYFDYDEITSLLSQSGVNPNYDLKVTDESKTNRAIIDEFREPFQAAIEKGLYEILYPSSLQKYPIVEIGAGGNYNIPNVISDRTIRIQPCMEEYLALKKPSPKSSFHLDIKDFCHLLYEKQKKISGIFLLNVFDTFTAEKKQTNLAYISQLQNPGDKLHIILDVNPCIPTSIYQLKKRYPGYTPMPFIHEENICHKISYALIPDKFTTSDPSRTAVQQIMEEMLHNIRNQKSETQHLLQQLYKEKLIKVIALEDFFVEEMKEVLEAAGYSSEARYHNSFAIETLNGVYSAQELIYKPVTDAGSSMRQWKIDDPRFINWLKEKKLSVPQFSSGYIKQLKNTGQRIIGTEFLVIEATRL